MRSPTLMEHDSPFVLDPSRFSSWWKFRRSTAYVIKFLKICSKGRKFNNPIIEESSKDLGQPKMLSLAEALIFQEAQRRTPPSVATGQNLSLTSDKFGLLRVKTRLGKAMIDNAAKHPIFLAATDPVARDTPIKPGVPILAEDGHEAYVPKGDPRANLMLLWERSLRQLDLFWKQWQEEYLLSLRERQDKLYRNRIDATPAIGDLVLIHDDNLPRGSWAMARVIELIPSPSDGLIREVKIKTATGTLNRAPRHLYPLEMSGEANTAPIPCAPQVQPQRSPPETNPYHMTLRPRKQKIIDSTIIYSVILDMDPLERHADEPEMPLEQINEQAILDEPEPMPTAPATKHLKSRDKWPSQLQPALHHMGEGIKMVTLDQFEDNDQPGHFTPFAYDPDFAPGSGQVIEVDEPIDDTELGPSEEDRLIIDDTGASPEPTAVKPTGTTTCSISVQTEEEAQKTQANKRRSRSPTRRSRSKHRSSKPSVEHPKVRPPSPKRRPDPSLDPHRSNRSGDSRSHKRAHNSQEDSRPSKRTHADHRASQQSEKFPSDRHRSSQRSEKTQHEHHRSSQRSEKFPSDRHRSSQRSEKSQHEHHRSSQRSEKSHTDRHRSSQRSRSRTREAPAERPRRGGREIRDGQQPTSSRRSEPEVSRSGLQVTIQQGVRSVATDAPNPHHGRVVIDDLTHTGWELHKPCQPGAEGHTHCHPISTLTISRELQVHDSTFSEVHQLLFPTLIQIILAVYGVGRGNQEAILSFLKDLAKIPLPHIHQGAMEYFFKHMSKIRKDRIGVWTKSEINTAINLRLRHCRLAAATANSRPYAPVLYRCAAPVLLRPYLQDDPGLGPAVRHLPEVMASKLNTLRFHLHHNGKRRHHSPFVFFGDAVAEALKSAATLGSLIARSDPAGLIEEAENAFLADKVEAVFILTGRDALIAHQAPSQILEDTKRICQIMQRWEHARIVLIQTPYVHSEAALWKGYFHDFVQTILNHATTPGAQNVLGRVEYVPLPTLTSEKNVPALLSADGIPTKAGIIEMRDRIEGITGIHIPLKPDVPLPRASQDTPKDGNNDDRHDHGSRRSDRKEPEQPSDRSKSDREDRSGRSATHRGSHWTALAIITLINVVGIAAEPNSERKQNHKTDTTPALLACIVLLLSIQMGMPLWTHVWNQARRVWRLLHRRNFHQRRNQRTQRRRERRQRERRRGTRMFGFPRADENWNTQIRQGIPPPPFPPCYDNIERERREDFITSDSEPEFTVHFTPAEVRRIAELHRPRSSSSSSMGMSTLFALTIMASISICQGFSPMICPTSAPGALWRIKSSASKCEQLLDQGVPFPLRIYRPNTKHIAIEAHHCKIEHQFAHFFTDVGSHHHIVKEETRSLFVGEEECRRMIAKKSCQFGQMKPSKTKLWQTENPLVTNFYGWFESLFRDDPTNTTENCFLSEVNVNYFYGAPAVWAGFADLSHCQPEDGKCRLDDDSLVLWNPKAVADDLCAYILLAEWNGTAHENGKEVIWRDATRQFVLSFSKRERAVRDCGRLYTTSAQDYAVLSIPFDNMLDAIRIKNEDKRRPKREAPKAGSVETNQLAAQLSASQFAALETALKTVCNEKTHINSFLGNDATPLARSAQMFNTSFIQARWATENILEVWPCTPLSPDQLTFVPSPDGQCRKYARVNITLPGRHVSGFLDPKTMILVTDSSIKPCQRYRKILVPLGRSLFRVDQLNGSLERIEDTDIETMWLGQTSADAPPTPPLQMFGNMILTNLTQLMLPQEVDEAFRGFHSRSQMTNSFRVSNEPGNNNSGVEAQLYLWPVIRDFLINRAWHTAVTLVCAYTLYLIARFYWLPLIFQSQCSNCSHNPSHCAGAASQAPVFIFNGKPRRYVDGANSEIPGDIEMQPIPRTVRTRVPAPVPNPSEAEMSDSSDDAFRRRRPKWNFLSRECREPRTK
ncbi:microtubule-binding protein MIP-T3 domain-containing protein [Ditylenchus destructor]|uniref:Microtubule-binding protein MIP-T3 domain-containing protein n=1 Tax=Ditylenchus destructor TaxID=166010 RepID=A0AAD4MKZ8_9BILA|nr:microtubule-binding protein MIP-T3 domain-containing protein [Ditylenchus destructor]